MLDYFEGQKTFYIVMERPNRSISLHLLLKYEGAFREDLARSVFSQVLEAVQYCHSHGVIHRDIKDDNILIDMDTYQIKLIDFGCASFIDVVKQEPCGGKKNGSKAECFYAMYSFGVLCKCYTVKPYHFLDQRFRKVCW